MDRLYTNAQLIAAQIWSRLQHPAAIVLLPLIAVLSFAFGGDIGILLCLTVMPLGYGVIRMLAHGADQGGQTGAKTVLPEAAFRAKLDQLTQNLLGSGQSSCLFVLGLPDLAQIEARHGASGQAKVLQRLGDKLAGALRKGDIVGAIDGGFVVSLGAVPRFEIETGLQVAARLQHALTGPVKLGGTTLHTTAYVGFCLFSSLGAPQAREWLHAAQAAAEDALRLAPNGLRAFQPDMLKDRAVRAALREELEQAFERGEIRPWLQPQLSTDTGDVSGFDATARWESPERGTVGAAELLGMVEDVGLSQRLGEAVLFGGLSALLRWDKAGHRVPTVSVSFTAQQLRSPNLIHRLQWELDRLALNPARLVVQVLESVAAQAEDETIVSNLSRISAMGCCIDLEDFGTGQASIANIHRFSVRRVKINRSFTRKCDTDPRQKQMVAAILALCERLELETIGEGVESTGEHVTLAQLGCSHVQGDGIAKPMLLADSLSWIAKYEAVQSRSMQLGRG